MTKILVVEDERSIREGLCDALELEGYQVADAADGQAALTANRQFHPDLILLDLMLPLMNGYDVCRRFRQTGCRTPVIMLTAKGEELDKVLGLELGADDYITKPFGLRELLARIAAVLRRCQAAAVEPPPPDVDAAFAFGAWQIDEGGLCAAAGDRRIDLTVREAELLRLLVRHPGRVLHRDFIMREIWGNAMRNSRTLDQHLVALRRKLDLPGEPAPIETVYGAGYRFRG